MIPVVGAGFAERGEPEGVDAEIFQVGELFRDGTEVPSQGTPAETALRR